MERPDETTNQPAAEPDADAPAWGKWPGHPDVEWFLTGPARRSDELRRAWRIFRECIRGFRALHFIGPCVTVFGSARFDEDHRYYRLARETGRLLAEAGFAVMTGGGPGIMEAANRGARVGSGKSARVSRSRGRPAARAAATAAWISAMAAASNGSIQSSVWARSVPRQTQGPRCGWRAVVIGASV